MSMWFVFEGLDGVGKSTVLRGTERELVARGIRVETLSTPQSEYVELRRLIERSDRMDFLLGFYVGSAIATAERARALIEADRTVVVLVDRYVYSTLALAFGVRHEINADIEKQFASSRLRPSGGFLITSDARARTKRLLERGDLREIAQGDDHSVVDRVESRYREFGLRVVENEDGNPELAVAEVVRSILADSERHE